MPFLSSLISLVHIRFHGSIPPQCKMYKWVKRQSWMKRGKKKKKRITQVNSNLYSQIEIARIVNWKIHFNQIVKHFKITIQSLNPTSPHSFRSIENPQDIFLLQKLPRFWFGWLITGYFSPFKLIYVRNLEEEGNVFFMYRSKLSTGDIRNCKCVQI